MHVAIYDENVRWMFFHLTMLLCGALMSDHCDSVYVAVEVV